jgi:hypothetical protein
LETIFQGREYAVYGLPFYNDAPTIKAEFEKVFEQFVPSPGTLSG